MDKLKDLINGYKRFKFNSAIASTERNLAADFGIMFKRLWSSEAFKEADGSEYQLRRVFTLDCCYLTVQAALDRGIRFKDLDIEWSYEAVQNCYHLIKSITNIKRAVPYDKNAFAVQLTRLFGLLLGEDEYQLSEKPACQLYCIQCAMKDLEFMRLFFKNAHKAASDVINATTDEKILNSIRIW